MTKDNIITTKDEVVEFGLKDYKLLIGEGEFIGNLDFKHWGKKCNLICYFTTEQKEKVKLIVYRDNNENYTINKIDFKVAELETIWKCTYGLTKNGYSRWKKADLINYN